MTKAYFLKISIFLLAGFLVTFFSINAAGQKFWLTTDSFPGDSKTCITLAGDSCLLAGLTNSIIQSFDEGFTWDTTLNTSAIFCLNPGGSGRILAGGAGIIFYSDDSGESWDSVSINTFFPVTDIIKDVNGNLFAITAGTTLTGDYDGAGVFISEDNGLQWSQRNNGLGVNIYCDQIASDANGRLYLAVPDKFVTGSKGLFISDDSGLNWQHIDILVDGQDVIPDEISIAYTTGLSVSPDDSVYISIFATAVNVGVTLNIFKSINDITNDNFWSVAKVANVNHWWNDLMLNNIHFAKNGDWYSSVSGSIFTGGTFFSADDGQSWDQHQEGLGFDKFGSFGVQEFTEDDSGKVYMIQLFDERIYWADTSMILAVGDLPNWTDNDIVIFPNPVKSLNDLRIKWPDSKGIKHLIIRDITGKIILEKELELPIIFKAPEKPGIYLINVRDNINSKNLKVLVF